MLTEGDYVHSFDRYFIDGSTRVDRLEQVAIFGILSERKAKEQGVPFERSSSVDRDSWGARNTDNIIYLHSSNNSGEVIVRSEGVTVILSEKLRVVTQHEMRIYQRNNWKTNYDLEVYRLGRIAPGFFREIILPSATETEIEEARCVIERVNPVLAASLLVRSL